MPARYRERDLRITHTGSYWSSIGPTTVFKDRLLGRWESNEDFHGNPTGVNPLSIVKKDYYPAALNGQRHTSGGVLSREFTDFPVGLTPVALDPRAKWPILTVPERSAIAWKILAESNPSAPHVSLPSFLGELKDFTSLIKGRGDTLLKQAAQGYISWRWVVKPLYNDLQAMLKFTEAVNQRLTWLYHLRQGKFLKRRVHLGVSEIKDAPTNVTLHSEGVIISGQRQVTWRKEAWGTAQWKLEPGSTLPQMGYGPLKKLSAALAGGITSHETLATAWQLCPWSWFADWFTNLDETIAATNNTIGCTWSKICYMQRTSSVTTYTVTSALPLNWTTLSLTGPHYAEFVRKERLPVTPVLPFTFSYLPILDSGKWSILGALALSRGR